MNYRPFEKFLQGYQIQPTNGDGLINREKRFSNKEIDVFSRDVLENNPELRRSIVEVMQYLCEQGVPMPLIHITSKAVMVGGEMISTSFIENITAGGFRKRDTNVGTFVERGERTAIAGPDFYINNPQAFIKSLRLFLERYVHHRLRTNKSILGIARDSAKAIPAMVLVDGTVPLDKGTDYDDHYILKEGTTSEQVIGVVDIDEHRNPRSSEDIEYISKTILALLKEYYEQRDTTV